jgi:hypothetical protein
MRGVVVIGSGGAGLAALVKLGFSVDEVASAVATIHEIADREAERIQESLTELTIELTNSNYYETDFVQVRDLHPWAQVNRKTRERILQRVIGSRVANFDGYRKCRQNLHSKSNGSPGQIYRGRRLV